MSPSTQLSSEELGQLQTLRRQYLSLLPPYLLTLPPSTLLSLPAAQEFLVNRLLKDPKIENENIQPEEGYRKGFWRKVVLAIEEGVKIHNAKTRDKDINGDGDGDGDGIEKAKEMDEVEVEVDERLYEEMTRLMALPLDEEEGKGTSYRTFIYDSPKGGEKKVTLVEEQVVLQAGTTGLRTWTAALHLGHHILHHPSLVIPLLDGVDGGLPPIIELGAGTGFLSILLAEQGSDVLSTDVGISEYGEGVGKMTPLKRLLQNVELNRVGDKVKVKELDWTKRDNLDSMRTDDTGKGRVVIAADVIYDPDLVPPLVSTIQQLISPSTSHGSPSIAVIAATVRNPTTLENFEDTCQTEGLEIEMIDLPPMSSSHPTFWDSGLDSGSDVRIMRIIPVSAASSQQNGQSQSL